MSEGSGDSSRDDLEAALIETTVESWRFAGVFERAFDVSQAPGAYRYAAKVAYFRDRLRISLRDAGLDIVEHEPGASYDPGLAVTPLNLDDFGEADILVIDRVLEPTIMGRDGIRRLGTVLLRKAD